MELILDWSFVEGKSCTDYKIKHEEKSLERPTHSWYVLKGALICSLNLHSLMLQSGFVKNSAHSLYTSRELLNLDLF